MRYKDYVKSFVEALDEEIKHLRKSGGQKTYITNGTYLGKRNNQHIYAFMSDTEVRFPDDTPVDIEFQKKKLLGTLISVEGFDLIIGLQKNIGKKIATAILYTSPWFLLEQLKERLLINTTSQSANISLAEKLLGARQLSSENNTKEAENLIDRLKQRYKSNIKSDEYQIAALNAVVNKEVSFIWGPPGTGKTSTLGLAVAALTLEGESVLVLAHSNTAVDTAMRSVAEYLEHSPLYKEGLVLRYGIQTPGKLENFPNLHIRGVVRKQNPDLINEIERLEKEKKNLTKQIGQGGLNDLQSHHIQEEIARIKVSLQPLEEELCRKETELISKAQVVGCTLSKATIAPEIFDRKFDAVIVDEASMAYIPHCAFASTLASHRVAIFGDFRQLGPIAQSESDWLQRDIFEEAGITQKVDKNEPDSRMVLLKAQYRMYPNISAIPNSLYYSKQLKNGDGIREANESIVRGMPFPSHSVILYDIGNLQSRCYSDKQSHSRFNIISALVSVSIAQQSSQLESNNIGIIAPYNAQSRLIHRILQDLQLNNKIKVATVHRFQGDEQSVIIFDSVESTPQSKVGQLLRGGRQSTAARLSNVAVSRAKGKFIGVIDRGFIRDKLDSQFSAFGKFVSYIESQGYIEKPNLKDRWLDLNDVSLFLNTGEALQQINTDLSVAKDQVSVRWLSSYPNDRLPLNALRECSSRGINFFLTGSAKESLEILLSNTRVWDNQLTTNIGLIAIDRRVLWIYLNPQIDNQSPLLRISLPTTVKLLYSFLQLLPEGDSGSIKEHVVDKKSPLGNCSECGAVLWITDTHYGTRISCQKVASHENGGRKPTIQDVTKIASFVGRNCKVCGSQLVGRKNNSDSSVFLACSKKGCNQVVKLRDVIQHFSGLWMTGKGLKPLVIWGKCVFI